MNKYTYIDLFAGCGGLSLGMNQSGWKGLFAVEKSPYAFLTLKTNLMKKLDHFNWPEWLPQTEQDINSMLENHKEDLLKLRGNIDLVAGGPPCQGFSTAGRRIESDNRNQLIDSYISFIRLVQPKLIFFENVRGFTQRFKKNKSNGFRYSEYVKKALEKDGTDFSGYKVYGELVDFSDFGVPQKRTRFILIGIRKDFSNVLNPENFFNIITKNREFFFAQKLINKSTSVKDAISDLYKSKVRVECPDSKSFETTCYTKEVSLYQKYLRKDYKKRIPDSHRFTKHGKQTISLFEKLIENVPKGRRINQEMKEKFGLKKRGLIVLDPNKPAPTITSHPDDYLHYGTPRILTVRECARIQSFPDWFEFKAKYTTGGKQRKHEVPRYTQVGNAIPPLFSEQAGNALKEMLDYEQTNI